MKFKIICASLLVFILQLNAIAETADTLRAVSVAEIVVKATRMNRKLKNVPQKVEIITAQDIKSLPATTLSEVLKRATNLDIIQYPGLSATIGMRGFSPSAHSRSYTLILINGKPSGTRNLSSIDMNNVERIEVVKGPNASLYGSDAMGGVINIITTTRKGKPAGSISIETGSFGRQGISGTVGGSLSDKMTFGLGFSKKEQQKNYRIGSKNLLNVSKKEEAILDKSSYGDIMYTSKYELNQVNGNLTYSINKKLVASTQIIYTYANDVENHGNYWGSYGQSKKDISRLNWYSNLEFNTEIHKLRFSPYYTNEKDPNYSDNSEDGFISFVSKVQEYGFQLQDNISFGEISALIGMDYGTYDYQSDRFSAKGTPTVPYKPDNKNVNIGILANMTYSVDNLDLNAGLRFDHFAYHIDANDSINAPEADEKYSTFNPSIGAQYRISENLKAHSSFGTAFSVPDAYKVAGKYDVSVYFPAWDFWWTQSFEGNPDLKPEKSNTLDLGLKYMSPASGLTIDATYFITNHTNKIIEETLESGNKTYINADKVKMSGLELNSSYDFGALADYKFNLELYSNFTFLFENKLHQNVNSGDEKIDVLKKDMLYTRKVNGNFGLIYNDLNGFTTRLNARYIGSRLEKDNFGLLRPSITETDYHNRGGYNASDKILKHPDYLIFDYSVAYQLKKNISLGVIIANLLDENFSEKDGYNMMGRTITTKLSYTF